MTCGLTPRKKINLFHLLAVAPFLAYIGYNNIQGNKLDEKFYYAMVVIAILVFVYHGYRLSQ
jgi:membrane-bound metal-dependent hydrolase YbcI (DUF457 family)